MVSNSSLGREFLGLQTAVAGRYSLEREIGRGGMGIVYRATDVTLDRLVAIKLLPPDHACQADIHARFLREARTAAKLSHPNITPIFSVEEVDGYVFFVMAYVDGETLTERVSRVGVLNPHDAVRIFREVAWALSYAHAQKVIHRDIKPDNIMLERGSGRALVMDFGIAGDFSDEHGLVLGTPHYMSPEQAAGEDVSSASDLYSLGASMFFALSGRPPFDGKDAPSVLAHHIRTTPPRLSRAAPGTPTKLSAIVEKCLEKEPHDRFARAEDITEQLDRAIETKKEVPVAVRAFITRAREPRTGVGSYVGFYIALMFLPIFFGVLGVAFGSVLWLFFLAAAATTPGLFAIARARKLLTAGFDRSDLVRALEDDYRQRLEELPFIYGHGNLNIAKTLTSVGNAAIGVGVAAVTYGILTGFALPSSMWAMSLGMLAAVFGLLLRGGANRRLADREKRRVKRWKGWLGKWIFRIARIRLKHTPDTERLTHRPTEMAVGMAVLGLYESLPRATRDSLADLPRVVSGLEEDAQRMRKRVVELDAVLADTANDDNPDRRDEDSLAGQRARAFASVRTARDRAAQRLADAVAALETLRLDLLRIRAGEVSLESVTQNLGAARDVTEQVDRLLSGQDEVSKLLH